MACLGRWEDGDAPSWVFKRDESLDGCVSYGVMGLGFRVSHGFYGKNGTKLMGKMG
jgi:hypothetical protein